MSVPSQVSPYVRPQPHLLVDPPSGHVVHLPVGARLRVRFTRRGLSGWRIVDVPGHLVALEEGGWSFEFLVFDGGEDPAPLRLARWLADRADGNSEDRTQVGEVREISVVVGR